MKKTLLLALLSFCFIAATHAQIGKIPSDVTNAFKAKYPDAKNVTWKDNVGNYEAVFTNHDAATKAFFTSKGEWTSSERSLSFDELPASVKDGFAKSKYKDWKRGSVTQIKKIESVPEEYKIYVEQSSISKKFLFFDTNGKLIREAIGV